jgi:hypothetical protein
VALRARDLEFFIRKNVDHETSRVST